MARILITSGPTREYLDPVRYLTNASSGRMGMPLAQAALDLGHEVVVVTGPVDVEYPADATVLPVLTTAEMLDVSRREFATCSGLIGAAAPCDYRTVRVKSNKISKTGQPITLQLIETDDVVATLGSEKTGQWLVGFALETEDHHLRAVIKLEKKSCDLMVSNGPQAMRSLENHVDVIDPEGHILDTISGPKLKVARGILAIIQSRLIEKAGG